MLRVGIFIFPISFHWNLAIDCNQLSWLWLNCPSATSVQI
ncbi:hypothetical protein SynPROSU1_00435 [Synechococcus sp. PROS-U-1]|nr:hypothetical protein SynPROSU1_00435 [Synechococcus sp. PROS-U-1]